MRIRDWSSDVCSSDLTGDAAMVHLAMPDGRLMRDVFVSPRGVVLGSIAPDRRLMAWVRCIRGQLLLGKRGSWLVELAARLAIGLALGRTSCRDRVCQYV